MSVFSITLILSVLVLLPVVSRIYLLDPKNPLHRSIALAGMLIGLLGVLEYEMTHITDVETIEYYALFHSSLAMTTLYVASAIGYHFAAPNSKSWKKIGLIIGFLMVLPPIFVIYNLFFNGAILDMNHEMINGKWEYVINNEGITPKVFGFWFITIEIYLSVSHFVAYYNAKDKRERQWKLGLFLTFTFIPIFLIYQYIFAINVSNKGDYNLTPYLTILIIIISWIYTNFKLFEISPVAALDNILDSMSNIIIITDNDFKIKYANDTFEQFGGKRKDFIGQSIIKLAQITGKIPAKDFDSIKNLQYKERRERTMTFNFNGRIAHLLMAVLPTFNQQHIKIGYVFVLTDLTETVENRNQVKQYASELEQSNKELERFAYIASHDMKTPLRNIVSFINLIQRRLKNYDDKDVHEFLGFASSNARYMHSLVQDILEFSKIAKSKSSFDEVNINNVVLNVISHLQNYIQEKNAMVEFDDLPTIVANKTQIHQLFQNLIENGIKYNTSEQPQVKVFSTYTEKHLIITFEDNGIGIPDAFKKQIFDMFKRLHNNTTYQGTGIGLAICEKIVDLHNGQIQVKSDGLQGSKFMITFPIGIISQSSIFVK
ncbi:MAG: ATP-binding protein [Saprospiraceae bacterium]